MMNVISCSSRSAGAISCVLVFASCLAGADEAPDFTTDIAPLFTKYCTGCHNDDDREGKLSLASYDSLLKGGEKGGVVTPQQPELSRLVRVLTGQAEPKMPPDGEAAPKAEEIEVLKAWIAAGAKGPSGAGPDRAMLVTPEIKLLAPAKEIIHAVALAPDGDLLAIARHGEVELQSLAEGKTVRKLTGIRGSVNGVAFSRDGQRISAAGGEPGLIGEACVFKTADGSLVNEFRGHKDSLYAAVLSPDATILATAGYDSAIKLWNVADGKEVRTLDGHNGPVFELAFRADGNVLASASGDRTVKLWNVATGERLDTLKESTKELYTLAFSPDGSRLAAAGVDNRIRVWRISPAAKEGTNPLLETKFAHDTPVTRVVWSADGRTIASCGEDRLVKLWNADTLTIRETLEKQSDWASGLALGAKSDKLIVGRVDGSLGVYPLAAAGAETEQPLVPLAEVPPEVDYGPQPELDKLPKVAEAEPNDEPAHATAIQVPGIATGRVFGGDRNQPLDDDLFRFDAQAGDQWIIETKAARMKSPLDTKIEVLTADGQPVPRLLLRAVRDSVIEFRGMNSDQRGVRLAHWEEMLLNEYVYLSGEVIKHFQQRRGPDGDANFYPENGNRLAYFDTTSRAHSLGEPGYIVVPYAVGTDLPNNGLPVFTVNYENDDDAQRKLGKDSRLTFVAPADGTYLVRVSDVRGFAGDNYNYELTVRRPQPDFTVKLTGENPTIGAGSGKAFTVKAERIDSFNGPIRVDIAGVPPGFAVTTPLTIAEGLYEAYGVINALADAAAPTEEQLKAIKITATATVCGQERTKDVNSLGTIKLADKPKVIAYLEPLAGGKLAPGEAAQDSPSETAGPGLVPAISIAPGGTVTLNLRVERSGFDGRIPFEVANLPHGIIVDDIGLSGVLVREKELERPIVLRAEPWVAEQDRTFQATAQVEGNQSTLPLLLTVRHEDTGPP
ncbi:MAG TPA: c-type cytochrome domain-containing protein [Pirellulaceae bacterium]|nr:c-type cytochrome domain-containing protein [Pirellulaceae bacterium]